MVFSWLLFLWRRLSQDCLTVTHVDSITLFSLWILLFFLSLWVIFNEFYNVNLTIFCTSFTKLVHITTNVGQISVEFGFQCVDFLKNKIYLVIKIVDSIFLSEKTTSEKIRPIKIMANDGFRHSKSFFKFCWEVSIMIYGQPVFFVAKRSDELSKKSRAYFQSVEDDQKAAWFKDNTLHFVALSWFWNPFWLHSKPNAFLWMSCWWTLTSGGVGFGCCCGLVVIKKL